MATCDLFTAFPPLQRLRTNLELAYRAERASLDEYLIVLAMAESEQR